MADKTIILGDEYDDGLRRALVGALRALGVSPVNSDWGVAGSQELATLVVQLDGKIVTVEAETYVGLSISGDEAQVTRIAKELGRT